MNRFTYIFATVALLTFAPHAEAQTTRESFAKSYQHEKTQNYSDAIRVLSTIRERSYLVDLRLGWLYYLSGNYANSRQSYQLAIQAAPKAIEPRLGLTLPLLAQARYEEVEAQTRTILMMDPNNYTASLRLTFALRMEKKYTQARDINTAMLELYPTDVSFLAEQLLVSIAANKTDAKKLAETIVTLDPENVTAKPYLASLTAATNGPNGAPKPP